MHNKGCMGDNCMCGGFSDFPAAPGLLLEQKEHTQIMLTVIQVWLLLSVFMVYL